MKQGKLKSYQLMHLSLMCSFGIAAGAAPSDLSVLAGKDAWIVFLISIPVNSGICCLYSFMIQSMEDNTLHELTRDTFGKVVGCAMNLLFFIFLCFSTALINRFMGNLISVEMFPDTPIWAILAPFIGVSFYSAHKGLAAIVRTSEVLFLVMIGIYIMGFINISPKAHFKNALPPFDSDITLWPAALKSYLSYTGFTLVSFMFFINKKRAVLDKLKESLITGVCISTLLSFLISYFPVLIFGVEIASLHLFPGYLLASEGQLGDFLERTDAIIVILYFLGVFMCSSIHSYATLKIGRYIFPQKNKLIFTLILTLAITVFAQSKWLDLIFMYHFLKDSWFNISLVFAIILPIFIVTASKIKKKIL